MTASTFGRGVAWWLLLALGACDCGGGGGGGHADAGEGGTGDTGTTDARIPTDSGDPGCVTALPVDMVFIVDNSNSMEQEQFSLASNFPALLEILTNPPDADGDGAPDFPPLTDLRVAVVTTDMGVGDNPGVIGCDATGDEGLFVSDSRSPAPECMGVGTGTPPWLQFTGSDPDTFNDTFSCLARLGTDGCGLEQQLEASYEAIINKTAAGQPHEGFLRADSVVGIVYVTDEDDCSAADESIYDPSPMATMTLGHPRVRCAMHDELLQPVTRYIQAFKNLALDRRGDVVVAAITGVPRELVADPDTIDYDALLADENMQVRLDPMDDTKLLPACSFGGVGEAFPARRIVQVVKEFAATGDGVVQSICQPDLRPAIEILAQLVARRICPPPI